MDISAKAFDDIPGRKPGSRCPACKNGKLLPVIETHSGDNGIMGPDGRSWCNSFIVRLACRSCSTCFEVAKEYRGLELHKHLEEQLTGFGNPPEKPKSCKSCRRTLVECSHFATDVQLLFLTVNEETKFLYCDVCFKVRWVEKNETEQRDQDEV